MFRAIVILTIINRLVCVTRIT